MIHRELLGMADYWRNSKPHELVLAWAISAKTIGILILALRRLAKEPK